MVIDLGSPVESVLGVPKDRRGRTRNDKIVQGLGLATVGDLLHHFPRRYIETGKLTELDSLEKGQFLTLVGEIERSQVRAYTDRRTQRTAYRVDVALRTAGHTLKMTFFARNKNSAEWQVKRLHPDRRGIFLGQADTFRGEWQLTHPQVILMGGADEPAEDNAELAVQAIGAFYPVYPLTRGVESWDLQRAISFALTVVDDPPEMIPDAVRREHRVLDARQALQWVHAPQTHAQISRAQHRYRFEEALVTQLVLGRRRRAVRALGARARSGGPGGLLGAFDARLPFELTRGQVEVGEQIEQDLAQEYPMNRLLQGEVGSGKTMVALRAMLRVVDSGGQAALLAPTEVLAQQHHHSITGLLGDLAGAQMLGGAADATRVELLTGSMTKTQRTGPLSRLVSGESGIVIGTHALLEQQVQFFDLGLVVVDEQHRFGVEQRSALMDKAGWPPHLLVMTATPIPRTVAMTVFGDLEIATLAELPAGRAPIQTTVVPLALQPSWLDRVWERVREEVGKGHQAYVVCPRITGDELEQGLLEPTEVSWEIEARVQQASEPTLAAVDTVVAELDTHALHGLRIAPLHGRLPAQEKERTMRAFSAGEIDVLVATTVIEVGVDVANATTMVLLDADRFGISQLHQLRGRVGRGGLPGLCLLVTGVQDDLAPARARLDAVAATTDGFELSRVDLELRREGDVLGRSQSGYRSTLQNLRVLRDEKTIVSARAAAEGLLDVDVDLAEHLLLQAEVVRMQESAQADFLEKS